MSLIKCIIARLLGSRCFGPHPSLIGIPFVSKPNSQRKKKHKIPLKCFKQGAKLRIWRESPSRQENRAWSDYLLLTSKATINVLVLNSFWENNFVSDLHQVGCYSNSVVRRAEMTEARAAVMCYVLCPANLQDTCLRFDAHICRQEGGPVLFFCLFVCCYIFLLSTDFILWTCFF